MNNDEEPAFVLDKVRRTNDTLSRMTSWILTSVRVHEKERESEREKGREREGERGYSR